MTACLVAVLAEREPAEVRLRGGGLEPERTQALVDQMRSATVSVTRSSTSSWWASASTAAAWASALQKNGWRTWSSARGSSSRAAQREADAQAAQAVDLGEGPQQHQVGVRVEQLQRGVGVVERVELAVGLVKDHAHVRRHLGEEVGDVRQRHGGAGGVVGVADDHQPRGDGDLAQHRAQVVALARRRAPP